MNHTLSSLLRPSLPSMVLPIFLAGLFGMGSLVSPTLTSIASTDDPPTLVKHLRTEMRSKEPMRRDLAILDVIVLARCTGSCTIQLASIEGKQIRIENETGVGRLVDLDALTPDLLDVYRRGPADGHRLLALSALINIGNQKALEQLMTDAPNRSNEVQTSTNRSLAAFYLETYPELTKRALRSKRIYIEDVQRADRLRLKVARREAAN